MKEILKTYKGCLIKIEKEPGRFMPGYGAIKPLWIYPRYLVFIDGEQRGVHHSRHSAMREAKYTIRHEDAHFKTVG